MSWFSTLLGTGGVVDGIKEGVDKAILTPEERLDYHKELLKAYEPFKLIQRGLALAVTFMFGLTMFVEVSLIIASHWFPQLGLLAEAINKLDSVSMVGYSFMAIMSLYFSGGVISSFKSKGN